MVTLKTFHTIFSYTYNLVSIKSNNARFVLETMNTEIDEDEVDSNVPVNIHRIDNYSLFMKEGKSISCVVFKCTVVNYSWSIWRLCQRTLRDSYYGRNLKVTSKIISKHAQYTASHNDALSRRLVGNIKLIALQLIATFLIKRS